MEIIENVIVQANDKNFSEESYLAYNYDVSNAVKSKIFKDGWHHFCAFGYKEHRYQYDFDKLKEVPSLREKKMEKLKEYIDFSIPYSLTKEEDKFNFLTEDLKKEFNIIDTPNISANSYDTRFLEIIENNKDGLLLDCGAGMRQHYYDNVVNYEIANYWCTDVLGVGEKLPFKDNSFDAIISIAVLEHVKDPFTCAKEIIRVLKKGGTLYSAIPFLQPYHGYPHHYYNMTHQGHLNLYEQDLENIQLDVTDALKPIHTLTWFLNSYVDGLPEEEKDNFRNKKISELLNLPMSYINDPFVTTLNKKTNFELAAGTLLEGIKK